MKKLIVLFLISLLCYSQSDKICYVWHFDKKGRMIFIDTVSSVWMGSNFKYLVEGTDTTYYYSYTRNKKFKKSVLDKADVIEP